MLKAAGSLILFSFLKHGGKVVRRSVSDWYGLAMLAVLGLEHRKVQMRSSGVPRVAGQTDPLASFHVLAKLDVDTIFHQVDVLAKRTVRVLDQNIIGVPIVFAVASAYVGVALEAHHNPAPSGVDRGADGHAPVNSELVWSKVAV